METGLWDVVAKGISNDTVHQSRRKKRQQSVLNPTRPKGSQEVLLLPGPQGWEHNVTAPAPNTTANERPATNEYSETFHDADAAEAAEKERQASHLQALPNDTRSLYPEVFHIDFPGDTITVDPIGRDQWSVNNNGGSKRSGERGTVLDARAVASLLGLICKEPDFDAYQPTVADIESLPLYSRTGFQCWRSENKTRFREGELPAITALKHAGMLESKDQREIEWEQQQAMHRIDARVNGDLRGFTR